MSLLYYAGKLKLGECCAKPENNVRAPTLSDVREWLAKQDMVAVDLETWEAVSKKRHPVRDWLDRPGPYR